VGKDEAVKVLYVLLLFVPASIIASFLGWDPVVVFFLSALGIVPLAGIMGQATEELSVRAGPRLGGLLNATMGNAAELIITVFALKEGLLDLVKASITGSILGNILLVLGASLLVGGLRNGIQRFDRGQAGLNATMSILAIIALGIPSLFSHTIELANHDAVEYLSLGVAGAMIFVYICNLIYSFFCHQLDACEPRETVEPHMKVGFALLLLVLATGLIAWLSEILVGAVEPVVESLGVSEFFLGIVIIPLVGNAAEHLVAVQVAWKNKMELSLAVSLGSSLQIALFVAPLLVFLSLAMGNPLTLVFNQFEMVALVAASIIAALVALDGESNWMEGLQLLVVYFIVALAFFYLPTGGV
jgi:Ca2+:H+ antiporter